MMRFAALALIAAAMLTLGPVSSAQSRNNGRANAAAAAAARARMIANTQAQLAAARQVLAEAQGQMAQARGKLDAARSRIETAKGNLDAARTEEHASHDGLNKIEADLLAAAGPSSDVGKAHDEFEQAKDEFDSAKHRVLTSSAYKTKLAELDDSPDRTTLIPKLRKQAFLDDDPYQRALHRLETARVKFGQLRSDMVRNSQQWMDASKAVRDAQQEANKANTDAANGGLQRLPASQALRDAQAVALEAQATIMQCEALLAQLGVKPAPPPKAGSKN